MIGKDFNCVLFTSDADFFSSTTCIGGDDTSDSLPGLFSTLSAYAGETIWETLVLLTTRKFTQKQFNVRSLKS